MRETGFTGEIHEQPNALRRAVAFYGSGAGAALLNEVEALVKGRRRLIFTGMGTSLHAPYILMKEAGGFGKPVGIHDAGELLHFCLDSIARDDILFAVSQSGESAETKKAARRCADACPVVAIVNDTTSSLAAGADIVLPMDAGDEASISTKTYVNTLAILLMLGDVFSGVGPENTLRSLAEAADTMESGMEGFHEAAERSAETLGDLEALHTVARGSDLVTARQLALIAKEGAGVFTEALSAGLMRHGPIELAGPGHRAVFIMSKDNEPRLTAGLADEIAGLGSTVVAVADSPEYAPASCLAVMIPPAAPRCSPIVAAPYIELLVHEIARRKGKEAGVFRHATKVTDRE